MKNQPKQSSRDLLSPPGMPRREGRPIFNETGCGNPACPSEFRQSCPRSHGAPCPLEGRTVALIGGLDRMEPAYRELIGRLGGECLCHTGKVRSGCRRLRQMVSKADMVVFMTTINSHAALSTVKEECKRCQKPMCALRQTGQSSLEKILRDMAA